MAIISVNNQPSANMANGVIKQYMASINNIIISAAGMKRAKQRRNG